MLVTNTASQLLASIFVYITVVCSFIYTVSTFTYAPRQFFQMWR